MAYPLDDKGRYASVVLAGLGLGVDKEHLRIRPIGDPHLAPIQSPPLAGGSGGQLHAGYVGTGVGFTHGQGTDPFARDQVGEVLLLLFFGSVAVYLIETEIGVGSVGQRKSG